jgi:SAM-dependent methyltransferase
MFATGASNGKYNEAYYERGIEMGISCYTRYRWIPELTVPMAMTLIDYLNIQRSTTVLDFGCGKGFLVKALRLLYRNAWGIDLSTYAIENTDPSVKDYCFRCNELGQSFELADITYDLIIAKDVFEHIGINDLLEVFANLKSTCLFAVIPLGEDAKYRAPSNNFDYTHVTCLPEKAWESIFTGMGWKIDRFTYKIKGIKDVYYEKYPKAHGFWMLYK